MAILSLLVSRCGVREQAFALLEKTNLPTAITPNVKGTMAEEMAQYVGVSAGWIHLCQHRFLGVMEMLFDGLRGWNDLVAIILSEN